MSDSEELRKKIIDVNTQYGVEKEYNLFSSYLDHCSIEQLYDISRLVALKILKQAQRTFPSITWSYIMELNMGKNSFKRSIIDVFNNRFYDTMCKEDLE